MNLTQGAAFLGISPKTLRLAAEQREIEALHPLPDGPWLFKRSALQTEAASHLVERPLFDPRRTTESRARSICINDIGRWAV
jgi:hypothetical protein